MISKRFLTTSVLDSTKEWITLYFTQIPPTQNSNTSLSSNTLDLDSSKNMITLDQQTPLFDEEKSWLLVLILIEYETTLAKEKNYAIYNISHSRL